MWPQEAHEAIRPTDPWRTPARVAHLLDRAQLRVYTLIWQRALASQMSSAVMDKVRCRMPYDACA
jgi:DNA topoisomerase-1